MQDVLEGRAQRVQAARTSVHAALDGVLPVVRRPPPAPAARRPPPAARPAVSLPGFGRQQVDYNLL